MFFIKTIAKKIKEIYNIYVKISTKEEEKMEENQKPIKVKLHTFVIIIAIAVIIMMAIFIKVQKVNSNKKIQELQTESAQLQEKITELQGKLNSISNITNDK